MTEPKKKKTVPSVAPKSQKKKVIQLFPPDLIPGTNTPVVR